MEKSQGVFASMLIQGRFLGAQARDWALKNKPTSITGWLGFSAAVGVASAAIALALVIAIILTFCILTSLLGAVFLLGITLGFWLCVSAWMSLAFSAIAASLAAWLFIVQLGLGLLRDCYNWHWVPRSPAAAAPKATQGSLEAGPRDGGGAAAMATPTAVAGQHLQKIHEGRIGRSDDRFLVEPGLLPHGSSTVPLDAPQRPPSPQVMAAAPPSPSPSPSTSSSSLSPPSAGSMEALLLPPPLPAAAPPPRLAAFQ
ncbi:hypothetical protein Vretifemale_11158 [Volvox reticuliferus]|uniref:Uncharacterized protein n=1 Tax=Volvox reticuliferus TaxID=1737510 RepID=A0A8J4FNC5_9CHLO|nr:hypothetical protein Vretifemale_11158 [Volvox reticuliferus]